jgi:hypothetical protein
MGFYNPFPQMAPTMPQNFGFAPNTQTPRIDPAQFRQFAMTLNDNYLAQLA